VAGSASQVEWEASQTMPRTDSHTIRCLPVRLGISVREDLHRGCACSAQEQTMHINCLELLEATLAVKTFMKNASQISFLLQLDNATAVAYVNNMGGTVSSQLTGLVKELWLWALDKGIRAQHIPGISNSGRCMKNSFEQLTDSWVLANCYTST